MENIKFKVGNMFDSTDEYIGHGVNVDGIMGAGVAAVVRKLYPAVNTVYRDYCFNEVDPLLPGESLVVLVERNSKKTLYIANIASQDRPGANARLPWLLDGMEGTFAHMRETGNTRLTIPLIGCGIGGLDWESEVKPALISLMEKNRDITLTIYSLDPMDGFDE